MLNYDWYLKRIEGLGMIKNRCFVIKPVTLRLHQCTSFSIPLQQTPIIWSFKLERVVETGRQISVLLLLLPFLRYVKTIFQDFLTLLIHFKRSFRFWPQGHKFSPNERKWIKVITICWFLTKFLLFILATWPEVTKVFQTRNGRRAIW